MQIAIISDVHGNEPALEAAMDEIKRLGAERIVCLGDTVNPLPSSRRVYERIRSLGISTLRGNHEDYIINARSQPEHIINHQSRFRPIKLVADTFTDALVRDLQGLPLTMRIGDILFCHASPSANDRGWKYGISDRLAEELSSEDAGTILCGHWHEPKTRHWRDKTLISVGSVGLPLQGRFEAEFLMLDTKNGAHEHLAIVYDHERAIREYLDTGWFALGGPMARILMCELATATRQVGPFFQWLNNTCHETESDYGLSKAIQEFIEATSSDT